MRSNCIVLLYNFSTVVPNNDFACCSNGVKSSCCNVNPIDASTKVNQGETPLDYCRAHAMTSGP